MNKTKRKIETMKIEKATEIHAKSSEMRDAIKLIRKEK